ncbi:mitochondrial folate transporter/carrier [Solea senegalensis]|uniref:Solute carrier family 25 member 32 n=1 Tax=Solea senegalensis TaxID=28829 RepID=A0AAV6PUF1_SOLSE|nr:mitochondrial folate transporter/carrier-like [Solea senegalensis]KAG7475933.1 mitochondrial folate transporter/carrier [Solea senegalensis]
MSSAPNQTVGGDTGLSSKPVPAASLVGHVQHLFSHVKIENLFAGLSGGVVSTLVLHPLDLVKIRFAVSDGLDLRPKYSGMVHCMKSVWQQEGLRGLYQGVTPNVWGAGASWGLYFLFYNAIKGYKNEGRQTALSATEHLVSAAEAGMLTLTITNPIWVTKTRLVLQYNADPTSKQYTGMVDALVKIYRHEGIHGLYKGYVPGLFGTSHGALQFMAYEELKRDYNRYKKAPSDAKLNALEYISMAALSKIFAVATTYPYQVVRARLQDQHNRYNGVMDVIRRTWRNEGAIGFYKGIIPNVIRVTPACCITFVVYENVSRLLLG